MSAGTSSAWTLWRLGWRYLSRHVWQSGLMILGIGLGVAVVTSIDLANASAARAFQLSTEAVTGKTTHQITSGPAGVDEQLYVDLKTHGWSTPLAPVVTALFRSPELGGAPMQLLGVDPFAEGAFRTFLGETPQSVQAAGLADFLTRPGAVLLSRPLAERWNLTVGDSLTLEIAGQTRAAWLAGLLEPGDALTRRTLEGVALADIATAQELSGALGRLSRIDVMLPEDDAATEEALKALLPPGVTLAAADARSQTIEKMTEAFQLNLTALSLLALVVGLFLIYNTITFSVVQRRQWFGTLRCLGATRREIFGMVLVEALMVGAVGSLLGLAGGLALGRVTVGMVTQTVNDLYYATTVRDVGLPVFSLVKGVLLGVAASVGAAALPAWEAASVPARDALSRSGLEVKVRRSLGGLTAGALGAAMVGGLVFAIPSTSMVLGLLGTFFVVVAYALLAAPFLALVMKLAAPLTTRLFGVEGRMAPRNLTNSLSRTAVATAALMVAVAVTIGVGVMIESFRYTVQVWLGETLQGDVYLSAPGITQTSSATEVDPQVVDWVKQWPGAAQVDTLRSAQVQGREGVFNISATDNPQTGDERQFAQLALPAARVWAEMEAGGVLVSEPLANRLGLRAGESAIELLTATEWKTYPVLGVYYDYTSSEGWVMMAQSVYRRDWQDDAITAIGVRLPAGSDADAAAEEISRGVLGMQELLVRPNEALRRDVMVVFDRTFSITVALRILATVVAFVGVLSALFLLQHEKSREIGILRAMGLTVRQLRRMVMLETGLIGATAGILAFPTGYTLALILIYIINRRSFGWTLQLMAQPEVFAQAFGVALSAALLAGIAPAIRLARMPAAEAIRYE